MCVLFVDCLTSGLKTNTATVGTLTYGPNGFLADEILIRHRMTGDDRAMGYNGT